LPAVSASTATELREELIRFVTVESSKVRIGERLPGTTEVLESGTFSDAADRRGPFHQWT
ncbi:MAG: hypothetical protein ACLP53_14120, partial [Isosphaeraceae bacterium]